MPSVVCFKDPETILVGESALAALSEVSANNVVQHIKRMMVHDAHWDKMSDTVRQKYTFFGKCYRPAEIAGKIINRLKLATEERLREDEELQSQFDFDGQLLSAVITVPAQFGRHERQSTMEAAKRFGGFLDVKLLEEPVAAALSLDFARKNSSSADANAKDSRIEMIVDLGGGTLDVCLMWVGKSVPQGGFVELARIGDNELGGTDWDRTIAVGVMSEIAKRYSLPPQLVGQASDIARNYKLHQECEKAKIDLCEIRAKPLPQVNVDYRDRLLNQTVSHTVARDWFLKETKGLSDWCADRCEHVLKHLQPEDRERLKKDKLQWEDVEEIILVGGGSRVPAVQETLAKRSGRKVSMAKFPQHQVVMGAAIYARSLANRTILNGIGITRSPMTLGVVKKTRLNGKTAPKGIWSKVLGLLPVSKQKERSQPLKEYFVPMVLPSQPANEPTKVHFTIVPADATSLTARVIEKRVTRFYPAGRFFQIATMQIPSLPPPNVNYKDEVIITMVYQDDHNLRAEASCRGVKCDVVISEQDIRLKGKPIELLEYQDEE